MGGEAEIFTSCSSKSPAQSPKHHENQPLQLQGIPTEEWWLHKAHASVEFQLHPSKESDEPTLPVRTEEAANCEQSFHHHLGQQQWRDLQSLRHTIYCPGASIMHSDLQPKRRRELERFRLPYRQPARLLCQNFNPPRDAQLTWPKQPWPKRHSTQHLNFQTPTKE